MISQNKPKCEIPFTIRDIHKFLKACVACVRRCANIRRHLQIPISLSYLC